MHRVLTGFGGVHAQFAQGQHVFDMVLLGVRTGFGMECSTLCADLSHVTEHQQTRRCGLRQYIDGSVYRIRIGVVGVIDQTNGAPRVLQRGQLRTATDRLKLRQAFFNGL